VKADEYRAVIGAFDGRLEIGCLNPTLRPAAADILIVDLVVAVPCGRKRYTRAELVWAENQARKERQSSHGSIVSVR
jgi:hypothetical protein